MKDPIETTAELINDMVLRTEQVAEDASLLKAVLLAKDVPCPTRIENELQATSTLARAGIKAATTFCVALQSGQPADAAFETMTSLIDGWTNAICKLTQSIHRVKQFA